MKLHLLNRTRLENSSFTVSKNTQAHFLKIWHYHPEIELVSILKSTGTKFIGDSIEKFESGELVLIGKNLPHMWLNDTPYFNKDSKLTAEAIAVHFSDDFLGSQFFNAPEMHPIYALLERAERGVKFLNIDKKLQQKIKKLPSLSSFKKTINLIEILFELAQHKNYKILTSIGFKSTFNTTENKKLDKIYAYVFNNFTTNIHAKDLAEIANMNLSAFSRYFKKIHQKTFTVYLNELRIGYACKLLVENKDSITATCYACGYNNLSNFNRQFKQITKMTPTHYLHLHKQN